jgi:hypothetical protein
MVFCGMRDKIVGDVSGRAGPGLDDELLAELFRQELSDQACCDVR